MNHAPAPITTKEENQAMIDFTLYRIDWTEPRADGTTRSRFRQCSREQVDTVVRYCKRRNYTFTVIML